MENTETVMAKKSRVGRPAMSDEDKAVLVPVRFPPDLLQLIDDEAASRLDRPSRSALIRDLVVDGLRIAGRKLGERKTRK
jgi:metal-responsive CopG/Arc/MetJ family transcriptional regulator